jgi:hypothetical protein
MTAIKAGFRITTAMTDNGDRGSRVPHGPAVSTSDNVAALKLLVCARTG